MAHCLTHIRPKPALGRPKWLYCLQRCKQSSQARPSDTGRIPTGTSNSVGGPLDGIRVLDLSRIVAGPYCTMILGDLGAEILKVERPDSGDECRNWGPPFLGNTNESCYFTAMNRNKKSICIDFKSSTGRQVMYELAAKCDVLVENYVPGKLAELKLDYENIKMVSPHLIYCSLTGFGLDGPYSNRPGYDVVAASMGGLLHITGPKGGEPCKVGVAMTDLATGLYAHGAIMAALFQRTRTGEGQRIDCNLLSTQVACLINIGSNYLNAGKEALRWGTAHESLVPYESFPTSDGGFVTVGSGSDKQFCSLCHKMDLPELSTDERFTNNKLRVKHREVLLEILRRRFREKTVTEWLKILEGSPFPYAPVNNLQQVFTDPHVVHTGLVQEMPHRTAGSVKFVGPPVRYSKAVNKARLPPPMLGEHTQQVLEETLGYSCEKIQQLRDAKAIQ